MRGWQRATAVIALACGCVSSNGATSSALGSERQKYDDAVTAIQRGQTSQFQRLRNDLDDYPLAIYLDYYNLTRDPGRVRPSDARQFLAAAEGSPLPNRFKSAYLTRAGKDRRWADFLAVNPDEPNSIVLKCYYYRAVLAGGDPLAAWEGAERLWVHGKSRPKECDPLFSAWQKAGELSDEVVWARLLKAFDARERSLMNYVARKGSPALKSWSDRLLAVYRRPAELDKQRLPADQPYSTDIAAHGLVYLARYSPAKALNQWRQFSATLPFTETQAEAVESAIVLQGLFARDAAVEQWLPNVLPRLKDDKLAEIRLRWLLEEQDWPQVLAAQSYLSEEGLSKAGWRYWRGYALEKTGKGDEGRAILASVAQERDYYGFLAADHLGKTYDFNHESMVLDSARAQPLKALPGVQRVRELNYHDEEQLAFSEWHTVLGASEQPQRQQLALLAADEGWHRMAIDAASRAQAWDLLDLRFPMPYRDTFEHYGVVQRVPHTELMAIARRESAFFAQARSPVGARGLMQIMPATGKQVASQLGRKHTTSALYDVEHNVRLGSAYYRQLLDRFDGNRIFALAAYNAGPHRVDRWRRNTAGKLPAEIWVATIPYKETRNYVQAVLSYNVVFQYLQGEDKSMLTPDERQSAY